jgi:hypothetical protein
LARRASIAVLACALAGCQTKFSPTFPPLTRFHFPSGIAVDSPYTVDGGVPAHFLYVAGDTNFDYSYDRGIVYAIDLDVIGDPTTGLIPPELASDAGWDGQPQRIPDVADAGDFDPTAGYVYTDSLGGEMRLAQTTDGRNRLFLPSRFANVVEAIDVVDGGLLVCYGNPDAGRDCLNPVSATPLLIGANQGANQVLDVFGVSNPVVYHPPGGLPERDIFITHLRNQARGSGGVVATGAYGNNYNQLGASFVIRENVDIPGNVIAQPIGQYTADAVAAQVLDGTLFAVFTGRFGGVSTAIRILSLNDTPLPQPVFPTGQMAVNPGALLINIDLSGILKGIDGRGITFSSNGDRVFALSRVPNAMVVLKNTFQYPGQLDLYPSWVASLPEGPTEVVAIPRVNAAGQPIGDLVAVSCADASSIVFYDDDLGQIVAQVPSLGLEPFAIATAMRTLGRGPTAQILPGVRLFVTAFATGQIVVIDVPDTSNPSTAQVIALIGTAEDTSVSPVNPNSNIFTPSSGYGTPGLQ